jgi:hypothetical protein
MTRLDVARGRMSPGGRMWSESPVRYPRRRTATAGIPAAAIPPDELSIFEGGGTSGSWTISPPGGAALFDASTMCLSVIGLGAAAVAAPPAGWALLRTATQGPIVLSLLRATFTDGVTPLTFNTDPACQQYQYRVMCTRGESGGAWTPDVYAAGTPAYEVGSRPVTLQAGAGAARRQMVAAYSWYDGWVRPGGPQYVGDIGPNYAAINFDGQNGVSDGLGPNTPGGAWVEAGPWLVTRGQDTGTFRHATIGAYGDPSHISFNWIYA